MPKVQTSHGVYDVSDEVAAEVAATKARPLRTVPSSWWDEETAVNMKRYIDLEIEFGPTWAGGFWDGNG